jgi:hypothetical protein
VLLAEPPVWQTLLSRFWPDGGTALGKLIGVAAAAEGPAGDQAVHAGLTAIGDGLFEGDPTGWEVSRRNVAAVAPELGRAVAAHVGVAAEALWVGVDGTQCAGATDALRGLAYLTVDRDAATTVGRALYDWAGGEVATAGAADAPALVAAVAVPSAFVAAQEYGHRFAYALETYELQEAAELRQMAWSHSVALVPELLPGIWGQAAGVLEGYAAIALGADGTWENGADRGPRFDSGTGVEQSLAAVDRADVDPAAVAAQARAAFVRTAGALGDPQPAESPESDWFAPILDTFLPQAEARRRPGIADSTGAGVTVRRPG